MRVSRVLRQRRSASLGFTTCRKLSPYAIVQQKRWDVFRYKDVQQVLADYATFSAEHSVSKNFPGALGKFDPPRHRQLRGLISKAFTPRSIEELVPRLIQITDE